jgi:hypothetical protein
MKHAALKLACRLLRPAAVWTAVLLGGPALALDIDMGNAAPYSVFVFEDVSGLMATPGRLAVGGNLSLGSASLGAALRDLPGTPTLLVRGNIQAFNGPLLAGTGAGFGQYLGTKANTVPPALDLRKVGVLSVNFDAERVYLTAMSEQLRDLASTGQVLAGVGTVTLKGSNRALEVFSLTAAQAAVAQRVVLDSIAASTSAPTLCAASALASTPAHSWPGRAVCCSTPTMPKPCSSTA